MRALWMVPAGLGGVGIGLALGRRVGEHQMLDAVEEVVRNLPQRAANQRHHYTAPDGTVYFGDEEYIDKVKRVTGHPPELTFECNWCNVRYPLDEIHGVLIDHPWGVSPQCPGSRRFPKL